MHEKEEKNESICWKILSFVIDSLIRSKYMGCRVTDYFVSLGIFHWIQWNGFAGKSCAMSRKICSVCVLFSWSI